MIMKPEHLSELEINCAVITVSTTRTKETDTSGKTIQEILTGANLPVRHYAVIPDDIGAIRFEVLLALKTCNGIIVNGGTGLTHDDCTIEAIAPLLEKRSMVLANSSGSRALRRSGLPRCSPGPLQGP